MRKARSSTRPNKVGFLAEICKREEGRADSGFAVVTAIDEPKGDDNAESASDDIGDVANGITRACARDATFWIDAHGRGRWVKGCTEEGGRGSMLKLYVCVGNRYVDMKKGKRTSR